MFKAATVTRKTLDGGTKSYPPPRKRNRPGFIRDAVEMQEVLRNIVIQTEPNGNLKPACARDKAACARAWDVLQERIRILRGQPLPGQLRPDANVQVRGKGKRRPRLEPMTAPVTPLQVVPHSGAATDNTGETEVKQASNA